MQILMKIFSQHQTKHPWWTHKENQIKKYHLHIHTYTYKNNFYVILN